MCLVPTHMTFVHMNSINETLDIFLQIFMKEMQSIYIFQRHMIHCYILSFTYMLDGCKIKPCEAHQKFKHACLVFGKREFVFNDTVESNRNIARSFLSSWESFFSTWRKGPSGFSAWRKSPSDVQIALNDVSDVPVALNDGSDICSNCVEWWKASCNTSTCIWHMFRRNFNSSWISIPDPTE